MTFSNIHSLYEMDKRTLGQSGVKALNNELNEKNLTYSPYPERAGPGLCAVAAEIKRELDQTVTPALKVSLMDITYERFDNLYCDVRIYPEGKELAIWDKNNWAGTVLNVLVSFVIAVPPDDSLDTFARISLASLFTDDPLESLHGNIDDVFAFKKMLNVDVAARSGRNFDRLFPPQFRWYDPRDYLRCLPQKRLSGDEKAAFGLPIQSERLGKSNPKDPNLPITLDNLKTEVPKLIAALARELGVENIDPKKLKSSDTLYALMGFDHTKTLSLSKSIQAQFNVIGKVGGDRMVTVGNALNFAEEMIMDADVEWENSFAAKPLIVERLKINVL